MVQIMKYVQHRYMRMKAKNLTKISWKIFLAQSFTMSQRRTRRKKQVPVSRVFLSMQTSTNLFKVVSVAWFPVFVAVVRARGT